MRDVVARGDIRVVHSAARVVGENAARRDAPQSPKYIEAISHHHDAHEALDFLKLSALRRVLLPAALECFADFIPVVQTLPRDSDI